MKTPFDAMPKGGERIVYVRPVAVADLPDALRAQVEGDAEVIYSVHGGDGQRLALVADRNLAFHLARAHDCAPMSVH
jgi:hypothetical protein